MVSFLSYKNSGNNIPIVENGRNRKPLDIFQYLLTHNFVNKYFYLFSKHIKLAQKLKIYIFLY